MISILCGCLVTLAILLGPVIQRNSSPSLKTTERGSIAVGYPASWRNVSGVPGEVYGLRFSHELVLTGKRETLIGGGIVNGAPVPGGLPPDFAHHTSGQPSRHIAYLGGHEAVLYSGKSRYGARRLVLYVIPTDRGDLGLLCISSRLSPRHDPCALNMLTLTLYRRKAIPPGADPALDQALKHALEPVVHATAEPNLVVFDSAVSIAETMENLAEADESSVDRIEMLSPEPRDRHAVLSGLRNPLRVQAQALRKAAEDSRAAESARYEEAVSAITETRQQLLVGIANLRAMGFGLLPPPPWFELPTLVKSGSESAGSGPSPDQTEPIMGASTEDAGSSGPHESGSSQPRQTEPAEPLQAGSTEEAKPLG